MVGAGRAGTGPGPGVAAAMGAPPAPRPARGAEGGSERPLGPRRALRAVGREGAAAPWGGWGGAVWRRAHLCRLPAAFPAEEDEEAAGTRQPRARPHR